MPELAVFALALAFCLAASYVDLKRRVVPDLLTYPFALLGAILTVFSAHPAGFLASYALMVAVAAALALALFYAGAWAGGDVKLFVACTIFLGAGGIDAFFAPIILFALAALAFLLYRLLRGAGRIIKKRKEALLIAEGSLASAIPAAAVAAFVSVFSGNVAVVVAVAVLALLIRLPVFAWTGLFAFSVIAGTQGALLSFAAALVSLWAAATLVGVVRKILLPSLSYRVPVGKLREGMLPEESVLVLKGGKVKLFSPKLDIKRLSAELARGNADPEAIMAASGIIAPKGSEVVADGSYAGGLDADQLQRLKKLGKVRWLKVRRTAAFAPALCAAFLAVLAGLV